MSVCGCRKNRRKRILFSAALGRSSSFFFLVVLRFARRWLPPTLKPVPFAYYNVYRSAVSGDRECPRRAGSRVCVCARARSVVASVCACERAWLPWFSLRPRCGPAITATAVYTTKSYAFAHRRSRCYTLYNYGELRAHVL